MVLWEVELQALAHGQEEVEREGNRVVEVAGAVGVAEVVGAVGAAAVVGAVGVAAVVGVRLAMDEGTENNSPVGDRNS